MSVNKVKDDNTFKRVEKKYLLSSWQYELIRASLRNYIEEDEYGLSTICNVYYDTDNNELIRSSIEGPVYKEKLRLRSYGTPTDSSHKVYLEIKKKYDGIVYKRRIHLHYDEAQKYLLEGVKPAKDSQILREIDYLINFYKPKPAIYIAYDRIACYGKEDPNLRITFDFNIRSRDYGLELSKGDIDTELLLPKGTVLMEIKVGGAYPLWLTEVLSRLEIYPCSFSKYGYIYKKSLERNGNEAAQIEMNNLLGLPQKNKLTHKMLNAI